MLNHYIVIFLFFTITLLLSVIMLNSKNNGNRFYQRYYGNITQSMWGVKKNQEILYLTHNSKELIEQQIKNIYLKTIMLLNKKNVQAIQEADFLCGKIKNSLLENLEKITILPIASVESVEILSIIHNEISAIITSTTLGKDGRIIVDHWSFFNGLHIMLDSMEVKLYRANNFIPMMDMLNLNKSEEVLI